MDTKEPVNNPEPQHPELAPLPAPTGWQAAHHENFEAQPTEPEPLPDVAPVSWTSAEYISHAKTSTWYILFGVATVIITIIIYLITKERLASAVILIVGGSAIFYSKRPPAARAYKISAEGITIDDTFYHMDEFKSFSVVEEGAKDSIWFKPVKRFKPFLIIYFEPEHEQEIVEILSVFLPHEARELDNIDKISSRLKF